MAGKNNCVSRWRWTAIAVLLLFASAAFAQAPAPEEKGSAAADKRARAIELYRNRKQVEALPLFEELAVETPSDPLVQEGLGVCLISHSSTIADADKRSDEVKRAREALAKAKELGDSSEIVRILLEITPADGKIPAFSGCGDVETAMREGEAAFARRDLDAAIAAYQRAMMLDPELY